MEILAPRWVKQSKNGISEMDLQRESRVSDKGAWSFRQILIQVMRARDDGQPLLDTVEMNSGYPGGAAGFGGANLVSSTLAERPNESLGCLN